MLRKLSDMKIQLMILAFLALSTFCEGINLNTDEFYVPTDIDEGIVVSKTELLHVVEGFETIQIKSRMPRPATLVNDIGLVTLKLPSVEATVIDLNGRFVPQTSFFVDLDSSKTNGINEGVDVKASSVLVENLKTGKVVYRPEYILKRLTREKEVGEYLFGHTIPWVPDMKNDKSPALRITSREPVGSMLLLNGFVDLKRQNLFRENARVRKIEIWDTVSKRQIGSFTLEDSARYQRVQFAIPSNSFDILITDPYPGTKYSDICLTSLVFDGDYSDRSGDYGKSHIEELRKEIHF